MPWRPTNPDDVPSLGWELLEWWADVLPSPRDPLAPLIFTDEQARQLVEWFRIDPVSGQFVYRRGYSRRSKGWGKSPVEAAKAIAEFAGPVRFDGWDASGQPVGRPWGTVGDPLPWVQVGAVSEDQTDNTWSVVHYLLTENDGRAADTLGIDAGLTRCFLRGRPGAKFEPVTAAAGSREGQPITYAVLDETHLWTPRNGGVKLAKTLRRNVAKMDGRSYETTNSFVPGEGAVAEASYKAVRDGVAGVFADEVEAPREVAGAPVTPESPPDVWRTCLDVAYGDSWWAPKERLAEEINDTPWDDVCRFYFNWNTKGTGSAVDPRRWAELFDSPDLPADGERIALGFDGSISDDSTFLLGCTAAGKLFVVASWERPRFDDGRPVKDWRVPRIDVGAAVRGAFSRWSVGRMFGDPPKWATELETWAEEFRLPGSTVEERERVIAFDTNSPTRMARAVDRFLTAIREGTLSHNGDERLAAHIAAAHLKKVRATAEDDDMRTMYVIVKGDDGRKIDAVIAAVLAYEAAMTMPVAAKPTGLFLGVT
jgi:hypothetical protein